MRDLARSVSSLLVTPLMLPQILVRLFDWIDEQKWSRPGGEGSSWAGSPYPLGTWPVDGTAVTFEVESRQSRSEWMASYLGVQGYTDRLVPFARTGDDGSYAAFWIDDAGDQHIVHLGSGSGSSLACMLGRAAEDFVRLLAVGYPEICWLDADSYLLPPQDDAPGDEEERGPAGSLLNRPYRDWIERQGLVVPSCAAQAMGRPAFMEDGLDSHDPFCRWLAEICA